MEEEVKDKTSSYIRLAIWLIFIIAMVVIIKVSGHKNNYNDKSENVEESVKEITYAEKLSQLNNNYRYNYEININNEIITYTGMKMDDREAGTKIQGDLNINYFKENGYTYEVKDGGLFQIDNLYTNLDSTLLDVNNIKSLIKDITPYNTDETYNYYLSDKNITIYSDEKQITKIEITMNNDYYHLEFSDINAIKEINY